jgi:hypothetical protein
MEVIQIETMEHCLFTPEKKCDPAQAIDGKYCCVESLQTPGNHTLVDKVLNNPSQMDWEHYKNQCKNMKPREGKNESCVVGGIQNPKTDDWPVQEIVQNPNNPNARPYCVDGCSIPPAILNGGVAIGMAAINATHDNPVGHPQSSFYGVCKTHDICYQTCDKNINQEDCDSNLKNNAIAVCKKIPLEDEIELISNLGLGGVKKYNAREFCEAKARQFYLALSTEKLNGGKSSFNQRRQEMCQCC